MAADIADVETPSVAETESWRITAVVFEVFLGTWLLFLFVLALAWDPIDRRLGFRTRRRLTSQASQSATTVVDTREAQAA